MPPNLQQSDIFHLPAGDTYILPLTNQTKLTLTVTLTLTDTVTIIFHTHFIDTHKKVDTALIKGIFRGVA